MSAKDVLQPVNINLETSPPSEGVVVLNEENVGTEQVKRDCEKESLAELQTESSNNDSSGISKGYKRERDSLLLDELESVEEEPTFPVKSGRLESDDNLGKNYFASLPDKVMLDIFRWIPQQGLGKLGLVCRQFNRLIQDQSLWSKVKVGFRLSATCFWRIIGRQAVVVRGHGTTIEGKLSSPPPLSTDFKERLRYLDLTGGTVSNSTLVTLFNHCVHIKKLNLNGEPLSDRVLRVLSANKDLEALNINGATNIEERGFKYLFRNCTKLEDLNVSEAELPTRTMDYLCSHLPANIVRLNLTCCYVYDNNVAALAICGRNLKELALAECVDMTQEAIYEVIKLENLEFLSLSPGYKYSIEDLLVLKNMKSLTNLNLLRYRNVFNFNDLEEAFGSKISINKDKRYEVAGCTISNLDEIDLQML